MSMIKNDFQKFRYLSSPDQDVKSARNGSLDTASLQYKLPICVVLISLCFCLKTLSGHGRYESFNIYTAYPGPET